MSSERFGASRRDFLKLVGAALGGLTLSSCSGGGGSSGSSGGAGTPPPGSVTPAPVPNGYTFYRLYTPGDAVAPNVIALVPNIFIDDANHVYFQGQNAQGIYTLYSLTVDYSGTAPQAVAARAIAQQGQTMPDGRVIGNLGTADASPDGSVGIVLNFDTTLSPPGAGPCGIFMDSGEGLAAVADYNDPVGNTNFTYGDFSDLDMQLGANMLFVARYGGGNEAAQGVVFLPAASNPSAVIALSSDEEIPNADGTLNGFGLVNLDDAGNFVAQAFGSQQFPTGLDAAAPTSSFVIQGNVNTPSSAARLLSAGPGMTLTRAASLTSAAIGTSLYAPRITLNQVANIVESNSGLTLFNNGIPIVQTGQASPGGSIIRSIISPVFGPSGLSFYEVITDAGIELCVYNGATSSLLFSRGDMIGNVGVDTIAFGLHPNQSDAVGRLVGYVQMLNGQESVMIGIPS